MHDLLVFSLQHAHSSCSLVITAVAPHSRVTIFLSVVVEIHVMYDTQPNGDVVVLTPQHCYVTPVYGFVLPHSKLNHR